MNEAEVLEILRQRHDPEEFAFFTHVPSGTGGHKSRTADAMAFNLWPSRGLEVHGFEVKVSRADFLGELKKPAKSAEIQKFCDRWWIVTPKDIIKDNELPSTWGHIIITDKSSRIQVQAPKLESEKMTPAFIAGLMRTVQKQKASKAEIEAKVNEVREQEQKRREANVSWAEDQYQTLAKRVKDFEDAEGVSIERYYVRKPGQFKAFCEAQDFDWKGILRNNKKIAENFIKTIDEALHSVEGSSLDGQ